MEAQALAQTDHFLAQLVGTFRRFGTIGPVYEIVGSAIATTTTSPTMRIRVLNTGEELDYGIAELLKDPSEG